ncbi:MAG TPA: ADP-ribosylglycohydrolase family protein [Desulfomonilia bacterium]|nr:ADP-ribosylglycohydrolase family protein [Desulfomonilia bacterium]
MTGAIAGDIIGSVYESRRIKTKDFPLFSEKSRFTDDTVLTVALAEAILTGTSYTRLMRQYYHRYPCAGYGSMFCAWALDEKLGPYHSFGNGAAMRISPVGFAYESLEEVMDKARLYTEITHDHPDGIKGAQAVASAVYLARTGCSKEEIKDHIESCFGYDLSGTLDEIRPGYRFDPTCRGSVPEAVIAFLESDDFEDAIRNAVSLGGDSDTQACITGGIAQAFYGSVPVHIESRAMELLDEPLRSVTLRFIQKYLPGRT